jgi:catechol 2,3-dioxygenase-like lactoylglutathione lyase family enzyme
MPATVSKLTPVLVVDAIEPCLAFWTERLGFSVAAQVAEGEHLGFVILAKDGVELMYQTQASVAADIPALAGARSGGALFLEVSDVAAIERALAGVELVVPRRRTFYGMDEVGAREPGGTVVVFAERVVEGQA